MAFTATGLQAIVFDYGSTLIEFGERNLLACDRALADLLTELYGHVDFPRLREIRNQDRRVAYTGDFAENDLADITVNLVRELYGLDPSAEALERILRVRYVSFLNEVEAPPYVAAFLEALAARYCLGLLSNYPDGEVIRASLKKLGIDRYFKAVVVSGDVGRVKPHAAPFQAVLSRLGVQPFESLYVGDNWLGDVQGAKRAGMRVAWTVQYDTPEKFERRPGDHEPDVTLQHLTDLIGFLQDQGGT